MSNTTISEEAIAPFLGKPSIFPPRRHPFYIVAPPYVHSSAGIKAQHLLCHSLNAIGQPAFMIIYPPLYRRNQLNLDWSTPMLTPNLAKHHFEQGLTPLVVYPETVCGNPFKAPVVMRYIMNYPGLLGGDKIFPPEEIMYGYSQKLADSVGTPEHVLFVPVSNTSIFYPPKKDTPPRKGSCFWAAKYKDYHHATLFPITNDSVEITRDKPDSQTPQQIADLFRRSELFYTYENTALAIEAILCGCPTVFLPNEHFIESIGLDELGWDGFAWGNDPAEVERARRTVEQGQANYMRLNDSFWHQLRTMVNECYPRLEATPYTQLISLDMHSEVAQAGHLVHMGLQYWQLHGSKALCKKLLKMLHRDGSLSLFKQAGNFGMYLITAPLRMIRR